MNPPRPIELVGIHAKNSGSFIRELFALYQQRVPVVILKSTDQADLLEGAAVTRIIEPGDDHGWIHHDPTSFPDDDAPAQITFTSGTEGKPKAIVLSARSLHDVVERLNNEMKIDGSIKEYVGVPAGFSFGLGRFRACAKVGGSTYIPERGFDPIEIARMLEHNEINALSAVPTLLRTLLGCAELFRDGAKGMRWIEIGSQYMSGEEKAQLRSLFPNAQITQHYGLTEASRSTFLDITKCEPDALESVGRATGNTQVRIAEDGRIEIRGNHTAIGVLTKDGIKPICDENGWVRTNDLGQMRNGTLHFKGRSDDQINCGGVKLSPDAIERALYDQLDINGGLAIGRTPNPIRGDGVLVCIENPGLDQQRVEQKTRDILENMGLRVGDALRVQRVDQLPTTPTGKIQRSRLAELARDESDQHHQIAHDDEHHEPGDLESRLVGAWRSVLRQQNVSRHTSFYEHGGDSLSSIALMLALERVKIDRSIAARVFDGETIAQIVDSQGDHGSQMKRAPRSNDRIAGDAINAVRGLLVLWLISIHFLPGVWSRLPFSEDAINRALNPLYRLGTPGFAIVFGLGVGYFFLDQLDKAAVGVAKRIRIGAIMVTGGIVTLGAIRFTQHKLSEDGLPSPLFSALTYSVLMYYLLAVLSIPLWHKILGKPQHRLIRALGASIVCFLIHHLCKRYVPVEQHPIGIVELPRLMIQAKYNYFFMTGTVMLGVAAGSRFRAGVPEIRRHAAGYCTIGAMLVAISVVLSIDSKEIWNWLDMSKPSIAIIIGYLGLIVFLLGLSVKTLSTIPRTGVISLAMAMFAACGVLSLPMYIGHELVVPARDIMVAFGAPSGISLALSLGAFLVVGGYLVRRVMRIYA